ncbi:MAG: TonB-dependent siderophore receptor [Verrucomicrobia bacterium]|nr:TonB-dependent siderophore receptor [Verrucomicrobiota bacterium]
MKFFLPRICLTGALVACAVLISSVRAQAPAAPAAYGKAADNKNYAQQLVNDLMVENPELYSAGIHATPPGSSEMVIVAQTKDLIGKKSSASDLKIFNDDQVQFQPEDKGGGNRFIAVVSRLKASSGEVIGLAVLSFRSDPGVTNLSVHLRDVALLNELARKLPNHAALFGPMR